MMTDGLLKCQHILNKKANIVVPPRAMSNEKNRSVISSEYTISDELHKPRTLSQTNAVAYSLVEVEIEHQHHATQSQVTHFLIC